MTEGKVWRPNFERATDQEIAEYYQRCSIWADEKGIEDADRELRQRGKDEQADYLRSLLP